MVKTYEVRNIVVRPDFAKLMPPLSPDEYAGLEASIRADGVRDPLTTWVDDDGVEYLIDGHNRYEIAMRIGKPWCALRKEFDSELAVKEWMILHQLGRRNLNESQRGMLAAKLAGLGVGSNQHAKVGSATLQSQSSAAKAVGVSTRTVSDAVKVMRDAEPEVIAAVEAGTLPVSEAAKIVKETPERQRDIAARVNEGATAKNAVREIAAEERAERKSAPVIIPNNDRVTIHIADIADACDCVDAESVDWIITDPPYPKEFLPLYADLANFAAHALKDGGAMAVMIGQAYLPEVLKLLEHDELAYRWTMAYLTPGGQAVQVWNAKVNTFWKPVLLHTKGDCKSEWIGDVTRSETNDNDKSHHYWGQSESGMFDIMNRLVFPNQTICDPFLGGGTTGVVAVSLGCKFIGIEIDETTAENAKTRINARH